MLLENCRLRHLLILISLFVCQNISAQQLTYVQGEILISLHQEADLTEFIHANGRFNGKKTQLHLLKKLQTPMPIYRLGFDFTSIDERNFLDKLRNDTRIHIAQFNHLIQSRNLPNDPLYGSQWQYFNATFPMADLDAPLAWDVSTGGTTFDGDTIVVCVIDDGMETNHTDFGDNLWVNQEEIPNNGIDDDVNGYIDDYNGWNVHEQNDVIQTTLDNGQHGTPIMGIIGAKGNNGLGVTGLNWNIKLMVVVGYDNEAEVLEAYAYPLQLRKDFNDSGGDQGALVVATNSSWGTAFGQASDAPLWCNFYNILGQEGILSAGATINGNYDVDVVGDLPTTCVSDYLISVTNLDYTGTKVNAAGYGLNSIDLGAFGEIVVTTHLDNSYGYFSGTSAATPQIAGAIALLYAAPCPSLATLAKIDPPFAASIVKEYILTGASPNNSLDGITLTGGSLNLKNSIDQLMDNCDFGDCAYPYAIEVENLSNQSVELDWSVFNIVSNSNYRYREIGNPNWTAILETTAPQIVENLTPCTDYEIQVQANCLSGESEYSESIYFQTVGCCLPPENFSIASLTQSMAHLAWAASLDINNYELYYRIKDSVNWTIIPCTNPYSLLINLTPCTAYEAKLRGICTNDIPTGFTDILHFNTLGCPNCIALNYCSVEGNNDGNTWISNIQINQLANQSGFENGLHSDFTNHSTNLVQGDFHDLTIQTSYQFFAAPSYFSIWIDLNQDGDFDEDNELILQTTNPALNINSSIFIPSDAILGSTRMRVAARSAILGVCEPSDASGEVEDYCVDIIAPTGCIPPYFLSCAHTETNSFLSWDCNIPVDSFGIRYRALGQDSWHYATTTNFYYNINDLNPCTSYEYQVHSICGLIESAYSPRVSFKTMGCGGCIDHKYCPVNAANANFEWIESLSINGITNFSQSNNGYASFSDFIFNFNTGVSYEFSLLPGFSNINNTDFEYFKIWIDLNQDGDFSDFDELVFDQLAVTKDFPVTGNFILPNFAQEGSTKMRVSMKYNAAPVDACESNFSGEIEDYCVNIYHQQSNTCSYPSDLETINIGEDFALLSWQSTNSDNVSYKLDFKEINSTDWKSIYTNQNNFNLTGLTACTDYDFRVANICAYGLSQMSATKNFQTECLSTITAELTEAAFTIYPNPFVEYFDINFDQNFSAPIQLKLINATGQLIYSQKIVSSISQIHIPIEQNLPSGIYFLQVQTKDQQFTQRLIRM